MPSGFITALPRPGFAAPGQQALGWQLLSPGFEQQIPLQVEQASTHRGGGFPQVVSPQYLDASGHVEVITQGDWHAGAAAAISLMG